MPETYTTPDESTIRADLQFMTRHWHELPEPAQFEIRTFGEHRTPVNRLFSPDDIADAAAFAAEMCEIGLNAYVTRNPIRMNIAGPSATDADVLAARLLWADCDDKGSAGNVHRWTGPKWTWSVTTGRTPEIRAHTYWELDSWCHDLDAWRRMQVQIAAHFGSDRAVINPSRIMRIGGTVAHPDKRKQTKGYIREHAILRTEYPDARPPVTMDQMTRAFGSTEPAAQTLATIDTGPVPLDRERATIQALSGQEWHNAVIRLVASYVAKGLSDAEIHALTLPLTLPGYTAEDTQREVQTAINGARAKGWTPHPPPEPRIEGETLTAQTAPEDASAPLEWWRDIEVAARDPYIVKGLLGSSALSSVYGPSNSGKTFFVMDLAFHIAAGLEWRGRRIKRTAVLYLAAEGGRGIVNRIAALKRKTGLDVLPFALRRAGLDLLKPDADLQRIYDLSAGVLKDTGLGQLVIVVDTLSRAMAGGDENSAQDMTALIRNVDLLREKTGAHVILVHHTGKDAARGARGHSSLKAALDTEIEIQAEGNERAAMVTKQRDYQGGETFAFTLQSVTLGIDEDGDEITSCVVEPADSDEFLAKAKLRKGLGGNQKIVADTFDQMLSEGMAQPNPGGPGFPEAGQFWCVKMDDLRRLARGKFTAENTRNAFNRAMAALRDERGLMCVAGAFVWCVDRKVK